MLCIDERKQDQFNEKPFKERLQILDVVRLPGYTFDQWGEKVKLLLGNEAYKFFLFLENAFSRLQNGETVDDAELEKLNIPKDEFKAFFA